MSQSNEGDSPVKGGKEPVKGLQSNEGDSPLKGGKEPCQRSPENHYLHTVARREKSCAHS